MESKEVFVCVSEDFKIDRQIPFENWNGRALYYDKGIGRSRIYRIGISTTKKGMGIITYKRFSYAKKLCDYINEICVDNFYPQLVTLITKK